MPTFSTAFEAIGTHWKIDIEYTPPLFREADLLAKIHARIEEFDRAYSRFRPDSLVTSMSKDPGVYTLPPDGKMLLDTYQNLYRYTNGMVTPLIGNLIAEAGYDAEYSLTTRELHKPLAWDDALEYHFPELILKKPVVLDFGAAGKGYLVDIVSGIIREAGIESFCVDAGGDIFYANKEQKTLRVGLEHPGDMTQVIGVAEILNASICGSAGNRRAWGNFTHIINPHTLQSPKNILATWVIADTALIADALATCLFFVPNGALKLYYTFQYVIMFEDYSVEVSPNFPGEVFTS